MLFTASCKVEEGRRARPQFGVPLRARCLPKSLRASHRYSIDSGPCSRVAGNQGKNVLGQNG